MDSSLPLPRTALAKFLTELELETGLPLREGTVCRDDARGPVAQREQRQAVQQPASSAGVTCSRWDPEWTRQPATRPAISRSLSLPINRPSGKSLSIQPVHPSVSMVSSSPDVVLAERKRIHRSHSSRRHLQVPPLKDDFVSRSPMAPRTSMPLAKSPAVDESPVSAITDFKKIAMMVTQGEIQSPLRPSHETMRSDEFSRWQSSPKRRPRRPAKEATLSPPVRKSSSDNETATYNKCHSHCATNLPRLA